MYFQYVVSEELPRLGWCAVFTEGENKIFVKTGKNVEKFPHFFVEGAWDGPFMEGGFDQSTLFCGSGIYLEDYGNGGGCACSRIKPYTGAFGFIKKRKSIIYF